MPIYSLGPPRMTRKVLTPEEFHEQMRLLQAEEKRSLEARLDPALPKGKAHKRNRLEQSLHDPSKAEIDSITVTARKRRLSSCPVRTSSVKNLQNIQLGN